VASFAVLRFITNSNFVGSITDGPLDLSPPRDDDHDVQDAPTEQQNSLVSLRRNETERLASVSMTDANAQPRDDAMVGFRQEWPRLYLSTEERSPTSPAGQRGPRGHLPTNCN
jgi:hypothetical protein